MKRESDPDTDWILNHLGEDRVDYRNAVAPPVFQSSIFCFDSVAQMRAALSDELATPFYTRGCNPTVETLRRKLAALEGAQDCLLFASGSAAIAAAVMDNVSQGDHVVCVQKPYSWTGKLLSKLLARFGVLVDYVDATKIDAVEAALRANTRLLFLESPCSLTFEMQDLVALATIARERGIKTICDNSYATPINQRPLDWGVDMVVHSASKYLNGHSDVVAGVLCASSNCIRSIFEGPFMTLGGIISPHDAWLMMRGLRTLPLRLERVAKTALKVIEFLEAHPRVARVYHPFAKSFSQPELTRKYLAQPGGLLSLSLKNGNDAAAERFCDSLKRFLIACSWGGYESLVFPLCGLSDSENYQQSQALGAGLVRLSLGLEDASVLIDDLDQALNTLS